MLSLQHSLIYQSFWTLNIAAPELAWLNNEALVVAKKNSFKHFLVEMMERIINSFGRFFLRSPLEEIPACGHEFHYPKRRILIMRRRGAQEIRKPFRRELSSRHLKYQTRSFPFFRLIGATTLTGTFAQSPINVHALNLRRLSTL